MYIGNVISKQEIRDGFTGPIIGYVETDDKGNQLARKFGGMIVGYYDAMMDVTRTFGGMTVSRGNTATGLLYHNDI